MPPKRRYEEITCDLTVIGLMMLIALMMTGAVNNPYDRFVTCFAALCAVLLIISIRNRRHVYTAKAHFLFGLGFLMTAFSSDPRVQLFSLFVAVAAIISRKVTGVCLYTVMENRSVRYPKLLSFSWDYIFPAIGALQFYRLAL